MQSTSWNGLWRYNYISGNGSGAGGMWTDLSQNLYTGPDDYDDFNPQSGYNLCVAVSPADPNVVVSWEERIFTEVQMDSILRIV